MIQYTTVYTVHSNRTRCRC